jgi:hypothetical protein
MIASRRSVIIGPAIAAVGSLWLGLGGLGSAGFPATFSFRGEGFTFYTPIQPSSPP